MKIAEALLLRKQYSEKVAQLTPITEIGEKGLFETKIKRLNVNDQVDEISMQIPRVTMKDVTAEYDYYASELRKLDAAIQKANWEFSVDFKQARKPEIKTEQK